MPTTKNEGDVHVIDNSQNSRFNEEIQQGRPESGSTDQPIRFTLFRNEKAKSARVLERSGISTLAGCVRGTKAPSKEQLPLIKLARFSGEPSENNALRYDAAVTELWGAELDYDRGEMPIDEAAKRLHQAGVEALLYETPSSLPEKPRWRVLCFTSRTYTGTTDELKELRAKWVARLNGVLDGIAAGESFTLSQAYYVGNVEGKPPVTVIFTKGAQVDTLDHLDAGAIYKNGSAEPPRRIAHAPVPDDLSESDDDPELLAEGRSRVANHVRKFGPGTAPMGNREFQLVNWLGDMRYGGLILSAEGIAELIEDACPMTRLVDIEDMLARRENERGCELLQEPGLDDEEPDAVAGGAEPEEATAVGWHTLEETETALAQMAEGFYQSDEPRIRLTRSDPGTGKSKHYQQASAHLDPPRVEKDVDDLLAENLAALDGEHELTGEALNAALDKILNEDLANIGKPEKQDRLLTFVPDHKMVAQYVADSTAMGLRNMGLRGRTQGADPLCRRPDEVRAAERLGLPIMSTMCRRMEDGVESLCPHYADCPYMEQLRKARWYPRVTAPFATAALPWESRDPNGMLPHPSNFKRVIVDEDVTFTFLEKTPVSLEALRLFNHDGLKGADIIGASHAKEGALSYLAAKGVTWQQLQQAAGDRADAEREAYLVVRPSDDAETIKKALSKFKPPAALAIVFERLAAEMQTGRRGHSKTLLWEGEQLITQGRRKLWDTTGQRIELLDGTADPRLLRFLFPELEAPPPIRVKRNLLTVQVRDRTFSRHSLLVADDAPRLRAEIMQFLERLAACGRKVLVVTYKAVRVLLTGEDPASLPLSVKKFGCEISHFGRIRGQNAFKECDTVVVIGRNELGFKGAENLAMALTFDDAVEITRIEPDAAGHEGYRIERRPYLMRDGSKRSAKVSVHPDAIVQAIVEQKREGETLQAVDRIRSVRSPQRKEFFHLCSIPLPGVEVDRLVRWEELAGNRKLNSILKIHARPQLRALPLSPSWLAHRFPEDGRPRRQQRDGSNITRSII
jgi:hypothetical protein